MYLQQHRNVYGLLQALKRQGYQGSKRTLVRYVRRLRETEALNTSAKVSRPAHRSKRTAISTVPAAPLSANQATWFVMRPARERTREQERIITSLKAQSSILKTAIDLSEQFCQLIRDRHAEQFETWLEQATRSQLLPFEKFAQGLQQDDEAVKAAMSLPVSNGPVEGQVNRLKALKRRMYGRAGIKLLERRFLLAS